MTVVFQNVDLWAGSKKKKQEKKQKNGKKKEKPSMTRKAKRRPKASICGAFEEVELISSTAVLLHQHVYLSCLFQLTAILTAPIPFCTP